MCSLAGGENLLTYLLSKTILVFVLFADGGDLFAYSVVDRDVVIAVLI